MPRSLVRVQPSAHLLSTNLVGISRFLVIEENNNDNKTNSDSGC